MGGLDLGVDSKSERRSVRRLFFDYAIYTFIGCAVAALAILAAEGKLHEATIAVILMTPITFGYPIHRHRECWGSFRFWLSLAILALVHVIALIYLLYRMERFNAIWLAMLNVVEWPLIHAALRWVGAVPGKNSS